MGERMKPTTLADLDAEYKRMAEQRLKQLRARFDKLTELKSQVDAEMLVLADEIANHGIPSTMRRRSRFEVPECGTESGYQRHRREREKCPACTVAHREHERIASARRKLHKLTGAA